MCWDVNLETVSTEQSRLRADLLRRKRNQPFSLTFSEARMLNGNELFTEDCIANGKLFIPAQRTSINLPRGFNKNHTSFHIWRLKMKSFWKKKVVYSKHVNWKNPTLTVFFFQGSKQRVPYDSSHHLFLCSFNWPSEKQNKTWMWVIWFSTGVL